MVPIVVVSFCLVGAQQKPPPKQPSAPPMLAYSNRTFSATVAGKTSTARIDPVRDLKQTSTSKALYRKDDSFVVWDALGLRIRKMGAVRTTRLTGVPFAENLWGRLGADQNRLLAEVGGYDLAADRLLDHRRIGAVVYLLARWHKPDGSVWFDSLVAVDLNAKEPGVLLLEKFAEAVSPRGKGPLLLDLDEVSLIDRERGRWHLVGVDTKSRKVSRQTVAGALDSLVDLGGSRLGFVENTDYETQTAGLFDWKSGRKTNLAECKGQIGFLPGAGPLVFWVRDAGELALLDVQSSGRHKLQPGAKFRRIGAHVVVWIESNGPSEASLYEPNRWNRVATWQRPAPVRR